MGARRCLKNEGLLQMDGNDIAERDKRKPRFAALENKDVIERRALSIPPLAGLSYVRVRTLAREYAAAQDPQQAAASALVWLAAPDEARRMLAVWLLGYIPTAWTDHLAVLREHGVPDPSWRVQEALAQAFDAFCAATGYENSLPTIDSWLADAHPNARRAARVRAPARRRAGERLVSRELFPGGRHSRPVGRELTLRARELRL